MKNRRSFLRLVRISFISHGGDGMTAFDGAVSFLPETLKKILENLPSDLKNSAAEIRLIKNAPLFLVTANGGNFLSESGKVSDYFGGHIVSEALFSETVRKITGFSYYAHEKEIENGVITLKGGHRVSLSGKAEIKNGKPVLYEISSLSFRISRDIFGASDAFFEKITRPEIKNTVLFSPPGGGKTTALRDIARKLSLSALTVALIDCRGELSMGKGNFYSCDVLENYPKKEGIAHALSSLSPKVIICDEITLSEEVSQIEEGLNSGVKFIVSAHAENYEKAKKRPVAAKLLSLFDAAVFLENGKNTGKLKEVVFLD